MTKDISSETTTIPMFQTFFSVWFRFWFFSLIQFGWHLLHIIKKKCILILQRTYSHLSLKFHMSFQFVMQPKHLFSVRANLIVNGQVNELSMQWTFWVVLIFQQIDLLKFCQTHQCWCKVYKTSSVKID